ncbi:hypothetical protein RFI_40112, partial [Reticulomyxa filosa]
IEDMELDDEMDDSMYHLDLNYKDFSRFVLSRKDFIWDNIIAKTLSSLNTDFVSIDINGNRLRSSGSTTTANSVDASSNDEEKQSQERFATAAVAAAVAAALALDDRDNYRKTKTKTNDSNKLVEYKGFKQKHLKAVLCQIIRYYGMLGLGNECIDDLKDDIRMCAKDLVKVYRKTKAIDDQKNDVKRFDLFFNQNLKHKNNFSFCFNFLILFFFFFFVCLCIIVSTSLPKFDSFVCFCFLFSIDIVIVFFFLFLFVSFFLSFFVMQLLV